MNKARQRHRGGWSRAQGDGAGGGVKAPLGVVESQISEAKPGATGTRPLVGNNDILAKYCMIQYYIEV
jgi:hypothetical protein